MRPGELALYDSLSSSNIQGPEKSALRRWFESSIVPTAQSAMPAKSVVNSVGSTFRGMAEAGLVGLLAAYLHVETEDGLDRGGMPLDGVTGFAFGALGALAPNHQFGDDCATIGKVSTGIFSFRGFSNLLAERRLKSGKALPAHLTPGTAKVAGESNEDPVLKASKKL